jgi:dolichol-phosphate mannosyltransferase
MSQSSPLALSIVVPARDEAENLSVLIPEIAAAVAGTDYEIVIVDDGSTDDTAGMIAALKNVGLPVRRLAHKKSRGQSAALATGVRGAGGAIIVTLDGDGQNDPRFIPDLVRPLDDRRVGLVAGQRVGRKSSFGKKAGSRIANGVRRALLKDATRDSGCGIKAFRRDAFVNLPYFDTMHRFLPALFLGDGWLIAHVDVVDRPRQHGKSHYAILDRLVVGIPDLFGVGWLLRRRRRSPFRAEQDLE